MSDDSKVRANPYIHDDPIRDADYFIGRDEIIEKIEYELKQALAERPQYKNIGITGKKGAGKSSLSYQIQNIANKHGMTTVRIRLNNKTASNEIRLFKIILEKITSEIEDSKYKNFPDIIRGFTEEVQIDLKFVKFILSSETNEDSPIDEVPEYVIRNDLRKIYESSNSPSIVVILDKAHRLSSSDVVLQKLKNVFTEIDGYQLVLVGTDETFSQVDSGFSEIARVVEKFEVGPFDQYEETKECLLKPLKESEKDIIDEETIFEIHRLTGGHPYEINLLAYHMYGDYDRKNKDKFDLNSDVINDVLTQMEEWKESVANQVPNKVSKLDDLGLIALISAIEIPGIYFNWLIDYTRLRAYNSSSLNKIVGRLEVVNKINDLIDNSLLSQDGENLEFVGGNYSIAYAKYLGFSRNVIKDFGGTITGLDEGFVSNCHYYICDKKLSENVDDVHSHYILTDHDNIENSPRSIISLDNNHQPSVSITDSLSEFDHLVKESEPVSNKVVMVQPTEDNYHDSLLYPSKDMQDTIEDRQYPPYKSLFLRINIECLEDIKGYIALFHYEDPQSRENIRENIDKIFDDMQELGFHLKVENERALTDDAYQLWDNEEFDEAIKKLDQAAEINPEFPTIWLNKSMLEAREDIDTALENVNKAIELKEDWVDAHVQKGRLLIIKNKGEEAVEHLERAVELDDDNPQLITWVSGTCGDLGYYQKEVKFAREALDIEPDNYHAKFHEVRGLQGSGEYKEAVRVVDTLQECNSPEDQYGPPEDRYIVKAIGIKAVSLLKLGKSEESIETGQNLINNWEIEGFKRRVYYFLGKAYQASGQHDKSIDTFEKALEADKVPKIDSYDIKVEILNSYVRMERLDKAEELADELEGMSTKPDEDTNIDHQEPVVELEETIPHYFYIVSRMWAKRNNSEKSFEYLRRAVERDEEYYEIAQDDQVFDEIMEANINKQMEGDFLA